MGAALPPPLPIFLLVFLSTPFVDFLFSQLLHWASTGIMLLSYPSPLSASPFISASYCALPYVLTGVVLLVLLLEI